MPDASTIDRGVAGGEEEGDSSPPRYFLLSGLRSAAFPEAEHPGALVHVPRSLDRSELAVIVYLHGWENCVQNVVEAEPGPCVPDGPPCPGADLIGQLARSGRSAVLLVPELRYHARSSDPGALGREGALGALLTEVLARLAPQLGGATVDEVARIVVASHSGGFRAAVSLAAQGGVPVHELYLLDSLYGEQELLLDRYVTENLTRFERDRASRARLVNLYTPGGGTAERSRAMVKNVEQWLAGAGMDRGVLHHDEGVAPPTDAELAHPLVFRQVETPHSLVPITYFGQLLRTSALPAARPGGPPPGPSG